MASEMTKTREGSLCQSEWEPCGKLLKCGGQFVIWRKVAAQVICMWQSQSRRWQL